MDAKREYVFAGLVRGLVAVCVACFGCCVLRKRGAGGATAASTGKPRQRAAPKEGRGQQSTARRAARKPAKCGSKCNTGADSYSQTRPS